MTTITMRHIREGEVPRDGGTRSRIECGNLLAEAMDGTYMTKKVRVRRGRCSTVNVAVTDESDTPRR
jgi:phage FluMu protein Com